MRSTVLLYYESRADSVALRRQSRGRLGLSQDRQRGVEFDCLRGRGKSTVETDKLLPQRLRDDSEARSETPLLRDAGGSIRIVD